MSPHAIFIRYHLAGRVPARPEENGRPASVVSTMRPCSLSFIDAAGRGVLPQDASSLTARSSSVGPSVTQSESLFTPYAHGAARQLHTTHRRAGVKLYFWVYACLDVPPVGHLSVNGRSIAGNC